MTTSHVTLHGSKHAKHPAIRRLRDAEADRRVDVTVTLRGPDLSDPNTLPSQHLTAEAFTAQYGASAKDLDTVARVLSGYGLTVEASSSMTRSVRLSGSVAAMNNAFQANLGIYSHPKQGQILAHEEELALPAELDGIVTGVFGLDQRAVVRRLSRDSAQSVDTSVQMSPLTPADLQKRYNFPAGDGEGQSIVIGEFGGMYTPQALHAFCNAFDIPMSDIKILSTAPMPPDTDNEFIDNSTGEVMMDVEIIKALCPKAQIAIYFSNIDEQGFIALINQIITDKPVTVSISWGSPEDTNDPKNPNYVDPQVEGWSYSGLQEINTHLQLAAIRGITFCISSGDDGSSDMIFDKRCHINFPASSPYVLSVGGTMLQENTGQITEVTWWQQPGSRFDTQGNPVGGGATGGGVSTRFARPSWQNVQVASLNPNAIDGRVIPDVAALAGPPDYMLFVPNFVEINGQYQKVWLLSGSGGTSAAAPLWAALIARVNGLLPTEKQQRFLTPLLYQNGPDGHPLGMSVCNDITEGNNATTLVSQPGYEAKEGYDAVTGWGTPNGQALLEALKQI